MVVGIRVLIFLLFNHPAGGGGAMPGLPSIWEMTDPDTTAAAIQRNRELAPKQLTKPGVGGKTARQTGK